MTLTDFETRFTQITSGLDENDMDIDYRLIQLMNEMENQFSVPLFLNKKYRLANKKIVHLYTQIYEYRCHLYKGSGSDHEKPLLETIK